VRFVFDLLLASAIGLVVGLGSAKYAVENGARVDATRIGPWVASPRAGTPHADPYSAAAFARTGEIALGPGEGLAFIAVNDSGGRELNGACSYAIAGSMPAARLWTLTAVDANGLVATGNGFHRGLHSQEVLRDRGGDVTITVSTTARSGNWLSLRDPGAFRLVLRLYDTPLASGENLARPTLPEIKREDCR